MARIGVDTDILVRLFVKDDVRQFASVARLVNTLKDDDVFFINIVVLIETLWTLSRQYGYQKPQLLALAQALLERSDLEVDQYEIVGNAINISRLLGADISDALIGELNRLSDCAHTLTFDAKAATTVPGMELLA
ncbi:PIN domain-containing protein [Pararhizobium sp. PWRC1-1]|uniref:PIN domain-containing protein n=1 Tax=Pararhizobium sp. PWRC1-1 TaxID=2804566 RepID=UPI003CF2B91E